MKVIIVTIALVLSTATYAQVPSPSCPDVSVVQNFDVTRYAGKWYEQQKYPFVFELGSKCITAEYSLNPNGTVKVLNKQINEITGQTESIEGKARLDSTTGEAKLLVNFPTAPVHFDSPYWILATDYENFSVVWSCADFIIGNAETAWILTRERNPPKEVIEQALKVFEDQHISTAPLTKTDQDNCPKE